MLTADCGWHSIFCEPYIVFTINWFFSSNGKQNYRTNVIADECSSACTFHHKPFQILGKTFVGLLQSF